MAAKPQLTHPWLIAVWPGMGHVALNAGVYMLSKLGMDAFAELEATDLFDADHVEIRAGLIRPGRKPRNRFFSWKDPEGRRDIVLFLGEAQPPMGRTPFCRQLIAFAKELGIEQVLTFAAMATGMRPEHPCRVFAAATDAATLAELRRLDLEVLQTGQISGLNGVLLAAAAEAGLPGACLLGEMPQVFAQLPFPKASLAVLKAFSAMTEIEIDLEELSEQAHVAEEQLGELLARVEEASGQKYGVEEPEEFSPEPPEEEPPRLSPADERRIEELFSQAATNRAKAFELKRELDRLNVFADYEDRFLDLFKKPE
jgi:proteasome assembly chaperone (PAC2) family protein